MLNKICKELGITFIGKWSDVGGYLFKISNPRLESYDTSFVVFDTDRITLINKMNDVEQTWINHRLKEERTHA